MDDSTSGVILLFYATNLLERATHYVMNPRQHKQTPRSFYQNTDMEIDFVVSGWSEINFVLRRREKNNKMKALTVVEISDPMMHFQRLHEAFVIVVVHRGREQ